MTTLSKNPRYLQSHIEKALQKKMVFLGGPRQVGKTTFSLQWLGSNANETHAGYLNWDNPKHAKNLKAGELPPHEHKLVFDEIHKYAKWRNLLKGLYDTHKSSRQFLVTGSARLDYYRKGGDSLVNRYRYFRMHPLSLTELRANPTQRDLQELLKWGGFPEPFFEKDEVSHRIWQRDRISRVVREDLRDLEKVKEISLVELLVELLPSRVGSPLSIKSLREDIEVDHKTVERWLKILENLYYCFRIAPYGSPKIRAVKKEQKLYLYDWSQIESPGARLENLLASQLLKYCHWIEDTQGYAMELRYLRDTDRREVDFVVLQNRKPIFAVECKTGSAALSSHLHYFSERTPIPVYYQVHQGDREFDSGKFKVRSLWNFCKEMGMP